MSRSLPPSARVWATASRSAPVNQVIAGQTWPGPRCLKVEADRVAPGMGGGQAANTGPTQVAGPRTGRRRGATGPWSVRLGWALALVFCGLVPRQAAAQAATATWQWATRATCTTAADDYSRGRYIKVDGAGNVFSTGDFHGVVTLGAAHLDSRQDYNSFVVKYTPAGAVAWVQQLAGSPQETIVEGLAVDGRGNCYVSGYFAPDGHGVLQLGSTTLTGGGGFLVKFDPQGTVLWARGAGQSFDDLACTPAGEVIALGSFTGQVVFGATTLTSLAPNASLSSGFVVKYDAQGQVLWAQQLEGRSAADMGAVGLDAAGNAYVAAAYRGTATFGALTLPGHPGNDDVFVAHYSAAGVLQWAVRYPTDAPGTTVNIKGLATDAAGQAYLLGLTPTSNSSSHQWFVAQYTPQGTLGWHYLSSASPHSGLLGIATDTADNVYVSGGVAGSLSLGGLTLASSSDADVDLALLSFTAQGVPRWALRAGVATATEAALGVALDGANTVYVTGSLQGPSALGPLAVPQHSAAEEQFVAKGVVSALLAARPTQAPESLRLYPNPANGAVTVRWPGLAAGPGHLELCDALGRCLRTYQLPAGADESVVPLLLLRPGVYTVHWTTATATACGRLLLE